MGGTVARDGDLTIKRGLRSTAESCVRNACASISTTAIRWPLIFGLGLAASMLISTGSAAEGECPKGQTLANGAPDPSLFSTEASREIRAFWCEEYDEQGRSRRVGFYREHYPSGLLRAEASYREGRLDGPVVAYFEEGNVFLRGVLRDGDWSGDFALYHANGEPWLAAHFENGRLHGRVATHYPDGQIASMTHFQKGREDGIARTFYPEALGGGRRSETYVEADEFLRTKRFHPPAVAAAPAEGDPITQPAAAATRVASE